jgi:ketosteroid isomerase-like protein
MARISSAAYVTAVLQFLQAYNSGDIDACESHLDPQVEWHSAVTYQGRADVRTMLEAFRKRWTTARARPDDFREADGHVLMIVCFHEGDPAAQQHDERQAWIADMSQDGLILRVLSYTSPAEAGRAFDALAHRVHA